MTVGVSKGGIPTPMTVDELLELEAGHLAAAVIGMMCVNPRPKNFEALGNVLLAGALHNPKGRENLALALRRSGR